MIKKKLNEITISWKIKRRNMKTFKFTVGRSIISSKGIVFADNKESAYKKVCKEYNVEPNTSTIVIIEECDVFDFKDDGRNPFGGF